MLCVWQQSVAFELDTKAPENAFLKDILLTSKKGWLDLIIWSVFEMHVFKKVKCFEMENHIVLA